MCEAIVFDGDDTLWETEGLYDAARQEARAIVEAAGLDGARWEQLEREIDVANVAVLGHSADRFPDSCLRAYDVLVSETGRTPDAGIRDQIRAAARSVFSRRAPVVPGAKETLSALRASGKVLILLTKGDRKVQWRRVCDSGLAEFFDLIEIVEEKTPETIRAVLAHVGIDVDRAISVGNSVRSDILPSLAAGVQPVWIDAHVWEYERTHPAFPSDRVIELSDLTRLLEVVSQ